MLLYHVFIIILYFPLPLYQIITQQEATEDCTCDVLKLICVQHYFVFISFFFLNILVDTQLIA